MEGDFGNAPPLAEGIIFKAMSGFYYVEPAARMAANAPQRADDGAGLTDSGSGLTDGGVGFAGGGADLTDGGADLTAGSVGLADDGGVGTMGANTGMPGEIVECRARGRFRLESNSPYVGDRVAYAPTEPGKGYIMEILPRKNIFSRPPVTNVDIMVIVASAAIPVTDPYLIDRMTVSAIKNGCEAVICINKCDLDPAKRLFDIYSAAGFRTVRTSAETGEGVNELLEAIKGAVSVFTGNSGVGKSSILNILDPNFHIKTGDVSYKLGRGRHTTRHVELFKLPGGAIVADTPGFSAFDTDRLSQKEELQCLFPDFEQYIGDCRFPDCAHVKEPGCLVLEALASGDIQETRYGSYLKLYEQAKEMKSWETGARHH
ncbi:MAG: ribosome small subunit-dependent GTPase A [Oscillospiraceae bacterium]|nr:ribosome small subunit-dependent GTPase A [Oscillospiraceae bacterium]